MCAYICACVTCVWIRSNSPQIQTRDTIAYTHGHRHRYRHRAESDANRDKDIIIDTDTDTDTNTDIDTDTSLSLTQPALEFVRIHTRDTRAHAQVLTHTDTKTDTAQKQTDSAT